ncbi:OLC1v1013790C1 [Oldenlandia corymbosa var. corymbosa]|uniref:OLC1v1013790C1 n=1 Tax=Oldenlandia corymbosa var. corymbosa TaxID=529605 RepID=A0AAV1DZ90_OLDCO|nr:OLC1v1013790C1 [Oldenlandia corymbosa var. corymbosa]
MTKLFSHLTASGDYNLPRGVVLADSNEEREMEEVFRSSAMNRFGRMTVEGVPKSGQTFEIGGSSKKSDNRVMNTGGSSGGRASKKSHDSREQSYDVAVDHWVEKQSAKAKDDDLLSECMDILNGCGRFPNSFPGSYEVLDDDEDELDELVDTIMVSRFCEKVAISKKTPNS